MTAPGYLSEGRVAEVRDGTVLSETLSPVSMRGRLVGLRVETAPEGGRRLLIQDRTNNTQTVFEPCAPPS